MPAIWSQDVEGRSGVLAPRDWGSSMGPSGMTPTAFAFLIPVFVVTVFAPFVCVFCIRQRRTAVTPTAPKTKKPALRRAEARERLKSVTVVSSVTESNKHALHGSVEQKEQVCASSTSTLERECAICLSTLYAPSPPEPAKIATSPIIDEAATRPPSINDVSPEAILKLNICGHEFHAECLVSWVVLRKTSCPICRAEYITKEEMSQFDEEAELAMSQGDVVQGPSATEAATGNENGRAQGSDAETARVSNWRYFWTGSNVTNSQNGGAGQGAEQGRTGRRGWQWRWRWNWRPQSQTTT